MGWGWLIILWEGVLGLFISGGGGSGLYIYNKMLNLLYSDVFLSLRTNNLPILWVMISRSYFGPMDDIPKHMKTAPFYTTNIRIFLMLTKVNKYDTS